MDSAEDAKIARVEIWLAENVRVITQVNELIIGVIRKLQAGERHETLSNTANLDSLVKNYLLNFTDRELRIPVSG